MIHNVTLCRMMENDGAAARSCSTAQVVNREHRVTLGPPCVTYRRRSSFSVVARDLLHSNIIFYMPAYTLYK